MGRPSRYPEEYRREAVELYRSSDRSRAEVAKSLGISDGSLAAWVKQARTEVESGSDADERPSWSVCVGRTGSCGWTGRSCGRRPPISLGRRTGEPTVRLRVCRPVSGHQAPVPSSRFVRASMSGAPVSPAGVTSTTLFWSLRSPTSPGLSMHLWGASGSWPSSASRSPGGPQTGRPVMAAEGMVGVHGRRKWRWGRPNTYRHPTYSRGTSKLRHPISGGWRTPPGSPCWDGTLYFAGGSKTSGPVDRGLVDGSPSDHRPGGQRSGDGPWPSSPQRRAGSSCRTGTRNTPAWSSPPASLTGASLRPIRGPGTVSTTLRWNRHGRRSKRRSVTSMATGPR